ncbi:hypothetical protein KY285_005091 [Solanum tuberosum]|nr:hypothetical protein KY284_005314 [Solanum tuberosum]KAH0722557.1 hypothetical protein KY289_005601 [Solanum tuberosum]KAH0751943.1 hypothetical protein KY285_005091 [Solanum tuberosum]
MVHLHRQRLLQFLSGLNNSYNQARSQILMKTTEPTHNQTYAMIIEDDCQKSSPFPALGSKGDNVDVETGTGQLIMARNHTRL